VCQFNTETIGSLLDQSLDELWGSSEACASRDWVDRCPGCWAECEVVPNAIYTGDMLRAVTVES
jgi:Fe-coproporphyrin III synthase